MKKSIGLVVMSFLVLSSHAQTQSKKIIGGVKTEYASFQPTIFTSTPPL